MKQISLIITAALMLFMVSCSDQPKPAEEKPAAPAPAAEAKPAAFSPYKAMMFMGTVKDYDKWYSIFAGRDSIRKSFGLTKPGVGRGLENDKMVIVFCTASDIARAKAFAASPDLKEVLKKEGVTNTPAFSYVDVISDDTSSIPQHERLIVTNHVKDFDTWKKAYDAEGASTRAANGLVERAMARGVDDPNTVTILFAITDMAKAKARATSPELKKIMTDAGVDSAPQITWFKWVK